MEKVSLLSTTNGDTGDSDALPPHISKSKGWQAVTHDERSTQAEALEQIPSLHIGSIVALCFGMLTHSYLLISVFPYSGYMAIHFVESATEDNAGFYAGLLASSFNFGRIFTAYGWGKVADFYGRKVALVASLWLMSLLTLLFGLAPSFGLALLIRFSIGMANGVLGTNKTLVSDLGQGNEKVEARTMSIVLGMWAWGFFISPFVSGQLAEPVEQYGNMKLWDSNKWLALLLERFPFLLPNLLGAVMCIVSLVLCHYYIQETLPDDKRRSPALMFPDSITYVKGLFCLGGARYQSFLPVKSHPSDALTTTTTNEQATANDSINDTECGCDDEGSSQSETSMISLLKRPKTRACLFVFWGQSFVTLAIDEIFPLFCISTTAGFGLSESKIGQILSISGLIFAVCQYFLQSIFYNKFGLYGSIRVGALLCAPMILLVPISLLLNHPQSTTAASTSEEGKNQITVLAFAFLCVVLALIKTFMLVIFANISVAMNRTVPTECRASLNGLSIIGASLAKGLGPSFAGITATLSVVVLGQFGSLLMYGSLGFLCSLLAIASILYLKNEPEHDRDVDISVEMTCSMEFQNKEKQFKR